MILLDWLFKDDILFQVLATNLANIIMRKDDRYLTLGWCTLVRGLLEYENAMDQHLLNGTLTVLTFYIYVNTLILSSSAHAFSLWLLKLLMCSLALTKLFLFWDFGKLF